MLAHSAWKLLHWHLFLGRVGFRIWRNFVPILMRGHRGAPNNVLSATIFPYFDTLNLWLYGYFSLQYSNWKTFRKSTYTNHRQKMKQFCSRSFPHYLSPFFQKTLLFIDSMAARSKPFYEQYLSVLWHFVTRLCMLYRVHAHMDVCYFLRWWCATKHLIHVSLQKKTHVWWCLMLN